VVKKSGIATAPRRRTPAPTVKWRAGCAHFEKIVPAAAAAAYLETLKDDAGYLDPEIVYEAARDPKSPIHDLFEWDVAKAARAHWIQTAQMITVALRIVRPDGAEEPAYTTMRIRDGRTPGGKRAQCDTRRALSDPELARQVLDQALRELRMWRERYAQLKELAGLLGQIDDLLSSYPDE
jgi:hypothetical protein